LLDENIKAVARVSLEYNLGWKLAMSASAFALLGTALNWLVALMLMIQTDKDHVNLTNKEKDWKDELERREMILVFGRVQKKTHRNYIRSKISPWTWVR